MFELLAGWVQRAGRTVLCSTHDLDSLHELPGYFVNLARPRPVLMPLSAAAVAAEYKFLKSAPPSREAARPA